MFVTEFKKINSRFHFVFLQLEKDLDLLLALLRVSLLITLGGP